MIITITGKPCSGKGSVVAYLVEKYGFEKFSGGDLFRKVATERGVNILELNRMKDASIDKAVDGEIAKIGKERLEDNLLIDSRTAWIFIPKSFKVFLDVDEDEQVRRLCNSKRSTESTDVSPEQAKKDLAERWNLENERYKKIYGQDNTDPTNYDFVINNTNLSIEQTGEQIISEYNKFLKNQKK